MRLVTFRDGDGTAIGAVRGSALVPLRPVLIAAGDDGTAIPRDMTALLRAGEAGLVAAARALAYALRPENAALRRRFDPSSLLAPLRPGKILGVGRNYGAHAQEVGGPALTAPRIFLKPTSSVCGPGSTVRIPPAVTKPDWEAELAVVIGRPAANVPEGRALEYVADYTVLNDVTAREVQFDGPLQQTSFAKSLDGFCPMGPWITTVEEVGEPWQLGVRCWLNGELVQEGNTAELIFPVPTLIAYLSRYFTLQPGDVIATGTPSGSGHFRTPPRYLRPGDRLRMEVERVGVLEHDMG